MFSKEVVKEILPTLPMKPAYQPPDIDYPNVRLCMDNRLRCFLKGCPDYGPLQTVTVEHRHA
jgi:hypothetical protein